MKRIYITFETETYLHDSIQAKSAVSAVAIHVSATRSVPQQSLMKMMQSLTERTLFCESPQNHTPEAVPAWELSYRLFCVI